jgi:hypothetical protein
MRLINLIIVFVLLVFILGCATDSPQVVTEKDVVVVEEVIVEEVQDPSDINDGLDAALEELNMIE